MSWRERILEYMNNKKGEGHDFGMERTMNERRKGLRFHLKWRWEA
jgi:hypothetical protein